MNKKQAFSLLEIVVAVIILSLSFAGVIATFISSRRYVLRSGQRHTAVVLLDTNLNFLYNSVREDTYNTGLLSVGANKNFPLPLPPLYDVSGVSVYSVINGDDFNGDGQADYRIVQATMAYPPE